MQVKDTAREFKSGDRMEICITNARGRLTELIRRAESGDDVILTRNGIAVGRLIPLHQRAVIELGPDLGSDGKIYGPQPRPDAVRG